MGFKKRPDVRDPLKSFSNVMIKHGLKEKARTSAFSFIGAMRRHKLLEYTEIFQILLDNISPQLSVRPYKKAAATLKIPFKVQFGFESYWGLQSMYSHARKRSEYGIFNKFKLEAVDSFLKKSATVKDMNALQEEALNNRHHIKPRKLWKH